jgi:hypothetical protein
MVAGWFNQENTPDTVVEEKKALSAKLESLSYKKILFRSNLKRDGSCPISLKKWSFLLKF